MALLNSLIKQSTDMQKIWCIKTKITIQYILVSTSSATPAAWYTFSNVSGVSKAQYNLYTF